MNIRYFISGFYLFIILILQLTVVELLSFDNLKPDLLLIALVYFTLNYGQIPGIIAAFFTGLLFDIFSGGVIGSNSLSKVAAAFVAGYFFNSDSNRVDISLNFFVLIFLVSIFERILYVFVAVSLDFKSLLIVFVNNGLIPSLVTLVFSLFVLLLPKRAEII